MCLILFAHQVHSDLPLVVAANRDERYDRPTRTAGFWEDAPRVLAGRDLEAGGTWLGVTRQGRFAAVTNFRSGAARGEVLRSRGELTRNFLLSGDKPLDYAKETLRRAGEYGGFNLLLGDMDQLVYCENLRNTFHLIAPGIYGLSNHLLDTPWPKVVTGKNRLSSMLSQWHSAANADSAELLSLLTDRTIAEDEFLPTTGIGLALERRLSPIFIEAETYGTCCSTALIVDRDRQVKFHERNFYQANAREVVFQFGLEPR